MEGKSKMFILILLILLLVGSAKKLYHYNYVANTRGQARKLRLPGLNEFVCKNVECQHGKVDQCGKRVIYSDGDWGVIAYFTNYGVELSEKAKAIARCMVEARKKNGPEHIPLNLQGFSVSRSAEPSRPSEYKIFNRDI